MHTGKFLEVSPVLSDTEMASTIFPLVNKMLLLIFHSYLIIGRSLNINNLPDEVLQEVFEYVWFVDGDAAIANLSLVCSSWRALVGDDIFRRRVHFRWLSTVHDWEKASPAFREQYYVMYQIYECLGCKRRYKDMPGYVRHGKGSLSFYEGAGDANHPDYCLPLCGSIMGIFRPFWWLVWWSTVAFTVNKIRRFILHEIINGTNSVAGLTSKCLIALNRCGNLGKKVDCIYCVSNFFLSLPL